MNKLTKYQKNRIEKLDAVQTSVSIERRHKVFLEQKNLNLSQIVRDALDYLMTDDSKQAPKKVKD